MPPLTRPPQHGPFPNTTVGETSLAESSHSAQLRGALFTSPHSAELDQSWRELHSSEGYQGGGGFTSQLSGPGIPGSTTSPSSPEGFRDAPPHVSPEATRPRTSHLSMGAPRRHTITRPWTSEQREQTGHVSSATHRHSTDFTVRLPPLRLSRPRSRTFAERVPYSATSPTYLGSPTTSPTRLPPLQGDAPFAYEAPLRLPPPFTLQPQPLWDDPSFSPYSRPSPRAAHHQQAMASHELITLPPPSGHEGALNLSPPHFPAAPSSSSTAEPPSFRPVSPPPQPSLPGPSLSWGVLRRPDDDSPSRDHDVPR